MLPVQFGYSRPRFAATLHVCTWRNDEAYKNALRNHPGEEVEAPYTYRSRAGFAKNASTRTIRECNVLGLYNGRHVSLSHLAARNVLWDLVVEAEANPDAKYHKEEPPDESTLKPTLEALEADREKLQEEGGNLRGFLIGGKVNDIGSPVLMQRLVDFLGNTPFSILWGQPGGVQINDLHFASSTDTLTISTHKTDDPLNTPGMGPRKLLYHLKKRFNVLQIDPGDTLVINGTTIPMDLRIEQKVTPKLP